MLGQRTFPKWHVDHMDGVTSVIFVDALNLFILQKSLSWLMINFTYHPNMNFAGEDSIRFFARDKEGALSQLMIVNINVYDPCATGGCVGMSYEYNVIRYS